MMAGHTVDLTPTWRGLVRGLIAVIETGTPNARQIAAEELLRMAEAADNWNAHCKAKE